MRILLIRFLSALMLFTAAVPAFASAQMAGAHVLGCDMAAMAEAEDQAGSSGREPLQETRSDMDTMRVCPLSASCFTAMVDAVPPLRGDSAVRIAPLLPLIADRHLSAHLELDPPPPRRV